MVYNCFIRSDQISQWIHLFMCVIVIFIISHPLKFSNLLKYSSLSVYAILIIIRFSEIMDSLPTCMYDSPRVCPCISALLMHNCFKMAASGVWEEATKLYRGVFWLITVQQLGIAYYIISRYRSSQLVKTCSFSVIDLCLWLLEKWHQQLRKRRLWNA